MIPRLSIIVPIYNGENYLTRCVDSIYLLPLEEEDFEVIVIDDSSQDNTLQILNTYAETHHNMIVLHQETNQRQGAARNRGIDIARGEYIAFVDADDKIVIDGMIKSLMAAETSKVDICYYDFEYENPYGTWNKFDALKNLHKKIISSKEYLENYYSCNYNAPWRNLYRTQFLRSTGIRFVEGVRWEDCDWTVKVYAQAKEIQFVDAVGYMYAYNSDSTSSSKTSQAMAERIYAGSRLVEYAISVRGSFPGLSATLDCEGRNKYIISELRLRNVTKYSSSFIREMYEFLGAGIRKNLCEFSWPSWVDLMLRHRYLSILVLFFACPMAAIGREIVDIKRKI